jgi:hypothetical protein
MTMSKVWPESSARKAWWGWKHRAPVVFRSQGVLQIREDGRGLILLDLGLSKHFVTVNIFFAGLIVLDRIQRDIVRRHKGGDHLVGKLVVLGRLTKGRAAGGEQHYTQGDGGREGEGAARAIHSFGPEFFTGLSVSILRLLVTFYKLSIGSRMP